jgi:hypothetical protein
MFSSRIVKEWGRSSAAASGGYRQNGSPMSKRAYRPNTEREGLRLLRTPMTEVTEVYENNQASGRIVLGTIGRSILAAILVIDPDRELDRGSVQSTEICWLDRV